MSLRMWRFKKFLEPIVGVIIICAVFIFSPEFATTEIELGSATFYAHTILGITFAMWLFIIFVQEFTGAILQFVDFVMLKIQKKLEEKNK